MELKRFSQIKGLSILANDGEIGKIKDVLFDDALWTVRYFVVDAGSWLSGRDVLISPVHMKSGFDWSGDNKMIVDLKREQVKNSPSADTDLPVSRQAEQDYWAYYGYDEPYYWNYPGYWGYGIYPSDLKNLELSEMDYALNRRNDDPHLRSAKEVIGYTLDTHDGTMGSVTDLFFDQKTWSVRFLEADTIKWWPSKEVLIAVDSMMSVNWDSQTVKVDLTKEQIKESPEFMKSGPLTREFERQVLSYYGLSDYWQDLERFESRHRAA